MMQKKQKYLAECEAKMKKTVLWVLLDLVFIIVFNVVFFVASGFELNPSVWISYAFIHIAYLMVLITPLLIRSSSSAVVFGFSIYTISTTYFFIEFVTGLVFIFLNMDTVQAAIIVQVILAGLYAVMLISTLISNEKTADDIERQEQEVAYIKESASRVKSLIETAEGKKAKKEIEKIYDLLHSSPTKSNPYAYSIENQIVDRISELEYAVSINDENSICSLCNDITSLTNERNRRLRSSYH